MWEEQLKFREWMQRHGGGDDGDGGRHFWDDDGNEHVLDPGSDDEVARSILADIDQRSSIIQASSVKIKRRLKMNKHKHRKRRKRDRLKTK